MERPLRMGAVAYDPKVVPIWDGIRDYVNAAGAPMDYVLFSNYEAQVDALLEGFVDIAWNTNLAYVRAHRRTGGFAVPFGFLERGPGPTPSVGSTWAGPGVAWSFQPPSAANPGDRPAQTVGGSWRP